MNRRDKLIIINILLSMALLLFVDYRFTYAHEEAHYQIFESYGLPAEIQISFFGRLFRTETAMTIGQSCEVEACILAHNINEVVGYQMQFLFFTSIMLYMIGSTAYLINKDIEEESWNN